MFKVYDHKTSNVDRYLQEMQDRFKSIEFEPARSVDEALDGSQIVITATPSRQPIVRSEWIKPGVHITALGSDGPHKQELDADVFSKVDRIVADSIEQCLKLGEIHHAFEQGIITREKIAGELGQVVSGEIPGRESDSEITVCDLTGVRSSRCFYFRSRFSKSERKDAGQEVRKLNYAAHHFCCHPLFCMN